MDKYVLMLEDDRDDRYITTETLSELGIEIPIKFFSNSREVLDHISKAEKPLFSLATRVINNTSPEEAVFDDHTAILLMTHDYKADFKNLQKALKTNCSYIGILGPKKRTDKMLDALAQEGHPVGEADLPRIFSPAGLDIGANTPEEIALSIAAEVRSHFAGRKGMSLRLRDGTIYEN